MTTEVTTLQKALITIKKLRQLLEEKKSFAPIAIVGMSCRFPQVNTTAAFWELLKSGRNVISPLPEKRWELLKGSDEYLLRDESHPYHGGYLQDIAGFDAYFFGITPREAQRMDPQQRLLLEVAYEALEDAGQTVEGLAGSNTGVFASLYASQLGYLQKIETDMDALYLPTGSAISIAANRLSYLFDLRGPSVVLDTSCSSSLVAIHLACLNLQNELCDAALVGGVNINLSPSINAILARAKMLSADGQCHTFDAGANGYTQGEGVGAVFLKPLAKALKDKDRVYAVIMGSAVNQDGKTNGITAPNGMRQEALLKTAYATANVNPQDISYVECHGTGTFLGDPIELQALGEVVGKRRLKEKPCWIGSVKTNMGHLEPAAGMASLIKTVLGLQHAQIPPHLNFATPNPHIAFDKYNFQVPQQLQAWPQYGEHRWAGVSGFGFGGTNAHLVLRDLADHEFVQQAEPASGKMEIFTLSAKDPVALKQYIDNWVTYLENNKTLDLGQLCYNTHVRRSHYSHRIAITAYSINELLTALHKVQQDPTTSAANIFLASETDNTIPDDLSDKLAEMDLPTLARYYVKSGKIDWRDYEKNRAYSHCAMPVYPWQHKDYWPPLGKNYSADIATSSNHFFLGAQIDSPLTIQQFEFKFDTKRIPEIKDTYNILHAGYYMEMLAYAVNQFNLPIAFTIEDMAFSSPIVVPNNMTVNVQLIFKKFNDGNLQFQFYSRSGKENWKASTQGKLILQTSEPKKIDPIDKIKQRALVHGNEETFYARVKAMAMPADGSIRWTHQFWRGENEILCEFQKPPSITKERKLQLGMHFGIVDATIQTLFLVLPQEHMMPYVASNIKSIKFFGESWVHLYLYANLTGIQLEGQQYTGNWSLLNESGEIVAECENLTMTRLGNTGQSSLTNAAIKKLDLTLVPAEQRAKRVTDFLIEHIATIFSMPKADINTQQSLLDMGMDSLMALVVLQIVESFEVAYTLSAVLQGPSIQEIVVYILAEKKLTTTSSPLSEKKNPWIAFRKKQSDPAIRLFCFPFGGGGASTYRDWQETLPSSIEVCPIQFPGREDRMDELPINNIEILLDALLIHLRNDFDLPFAFFGYSFGALVAFELMRRLRKQNLPQPKHFFISACPDPRFPTKSLQRVIQQLHDKKINLFNLASAEKISKLSSAELDTVFNVFSENGITEYKNQTLNKEMIKLLLPIFIGDMGIVKSYQYTSEAPLDITSTIFLGNLDTWVSPDDHLGWAHHFTKVCKFYDYDSGHLFIKDNIIKQQVLQVIAKTLSPEIAALVL